MHQILHENMKMSSNAVHSSASTGVVNNSRPDHAELKHLGLRSIRIVSSASPIVDIDAEDAETGSIATTRLIEAADFDTMSECSDMAFQFNPAANPYISSKMQIIREIVRGSHPHTILQRWVWWSGFVDDNSHIFYNWVKYIHPWLALAPEAIGKLKKLYFNGKPVPPRVVRRIFLRLFPEMRFLNTCSYPTVMLHIIIKTTNTTRPTERTNATTLSAAARPWQPSAGAGLDGQLEEAKAASLSSPESEELLRSASDSIQLGQVEHARHEISFSDTLSPQAPPDRMSEPTNEGSFAVPLCVGDLDCASDWGQSLNQEGCFSVVSRAPPPYGSSTQGDILMANRKILMRLEYWTWVTRPNTVPGPDALDFDAYDAFFSLPLLYQRQIRSELALVGDEWRMSTTSWFDMHVV